MGEILRHMQHLVMADKIDWNSQNASVRYDLGNVITKVKGV